MIISRATPAAPLVPALTPQVWGFGGFWVGTGQHPGQGNSAVLPLCPSWEHPLRARGHSDTPTPRWGHPDPKPHPAPRARGWRHRALVATEHLTRGHTFGSCSILCVSHSSPSSSSPFKALRLHSTETISWPRPRLWLLGWAGSWALSGCQRCQEPSSPSHLAAPGVQGREQGWGLGAGLGASRAGFCLLPPHAKHRSIPQHRGQLPSHKLFPWEEITPNPRGGRAERAGNGVEAPEPWAGLGAGGGAPSPSSCIPTGQELVQEHRGQGMGSGCGRWHPGLCAPAPAPIPGSCGSFPLPSKPCHCAGGSGGIPAPPAPSPGWGSPKSWLPSAPTHRHPRPSPRTPARGGEGRSRLIPGDPRRPHPVTLPVPLPARFGSRALVLHYFKLV